MREFDLIDLTNLYFSGYRYVIVHTRGDHAIIKPLVNKAPEESEHKVGFHQLHILENEVIELANGIGWLPAYLPEDFFEFNDNNYVLS